MWCEGALDHSTITGWFKKICFDFKNLNDQARLGRPKTGFWGYAPKHRGKLGEYQFTISQSIVVCYLYNLVKSILSFQIVSHVSKILQNIWKGSSCWVQKQLIEEQLIEIPTLKKNWLNIFFKKIFYTFMHWWNKSINVNSNYMEK